MEEEKQGGEYLYKTSCEECGSSDANAVYSDGNTHCFSCDKTVVKAGPVDGIKKFSGSNNKDLITKITYKALRTRKIPENICRMYNYGVGKNKDGKPCHIACYYDKDKQPKGQKLRFEDKEFTFIGNKVRSTLFGQQLFASGRKLTITEGEIDTLSVAAAFDGKYPVVSIRRGAGKAKDDIVQQLDWIEGFDEIYIWFDNDAEGREAAEEVAMVLPVDKVRIVRHPTYKDASALLMNEGKAAVVKQFYNAEKFQPTDIISPLSLLDELLKPVEFGIPYFHPALTEATYGRRFGEVVVVGAGVSVGKTDMTMQQSAYDLRAGYKVGMFMLEQSNKETLQRMAGKLDGRIYHLPNSVIDPDKMTETVNFMEGTLYVYGKFGSMKWETIKHKIKYMFYNYGVQMFYIDNLTALNAHAEDERRNLDALMAELKALAQELNIWVWIVSHLNPPTKGPSHEAGGRTEQKQFTGSRAIMRWADFMFGFERNTLAEEDDVKNYIITRGLKDRFSGNATGKTFGSRFEGSTGLIHPTEGNDELQIEEGYEEEGDF